MATKKKTTSKLPAGIPDHAVDQATLMRFFEPPIGKSTFYNLVKRGVIQRIKEVQGYYLLNESLVRLGLPPVSELPATPDAAQREIQLVELALHLVAPDVARSPRWMLDNPKLADPEKSHVALLAMHHQREMEGLTERAVREAYIDGVLDFFEIARITPPTVFPSLSPA